MFEMIEAVELEEQLEAKEAMELAEQEKEIGHRLEMSQKWYQKALNEGSAEMAEYFQKEIDDLKATQISFEGKLGTHQGMMPEDASDESDYHQGKQISFGSSKLEDAEKRVAKWARDEAFHAKQVEADIKNGRDSYNSMSDMKSAAKQRENAQRELDWIKAHQG